MNKKITKLLSVFVIAGAIGTGAAGISACGGNKTPEHTHTPATTWQSDANGHWHNCTADDGVKFDEGAHVYDNDQDTTCNECGYEREVTPPAPAEPTVTSVTVTAAGNATTVANEGTLQLTAAVVGENNPATTVTWSIKDGATATGATVSANGLLSAGTVAGTVTVVATSTVDTSKKGEITITVEEAELDLTVEISGAQTVAEGGSITLTATVTGVPAGGDTGVIWSVDDETVATISAEGVLTAITPGSVTVTAKAKADETFDATYSVVVTAATAYDRLANRADNRVAENFSSYTEGQELTAFTDWGTKGVYEKVTAGKGVVTVVGGQAKGLNSSKLDNISVMVDFGAVEGVVEGYFKYSFGAVSSNGEGNSINFYNNSGKVLTLITNGSNYVVKNIPGVATQPITTFTCTPDAVVEVNFKFDLTNKTVTLKLDDTIVCDALACDISEINGFEVVTSNGGQRGITVDDIAVCGTELTLGTYVERTNAKVTALETTYGLGGVQYNGRIKGSYESAVSAATTFAEVDAAYDALYGAVLGMFIDQADYHVNQELWTENYEHDEALVTALKAEITDEIYEMTKIEDAYAAANSDFADRLEAAGIHDDSYYAAVDVTVVIYEKGTTTSVVKATADLTDKAGEEITLAALKDAIEVPSGYQIKALYSDAACTTAITGSLTLDAGEATTATTMTIYVEFEAVTSVTHTLVISETSALTDTTLLNDIFYGTKNLKTESDKNGAGYSLQISLTSGKVAAGDAPANGIKFTVNGPTTVTVVCGQKTDKTTTLSVLKNDGSAATVSNITKNGVSVSAFETLSKTSAADTYTFTLEAGTYHLGGAGGGAYIYALTVVETVAA